MSLWERELQKTMDTTKPPSEDFRRDFIKSEWENYRYQDTLRWSRIQTIALLEVALVTGVSTNVTSITSLMKLGLALFLTAMAALLAIFAEIDGRDADSHLKRALMMEQIVGLPVYSRPRRPLNLRGHQLMQIGSSLLMLFNFIVIGDTARHVIADYRVPGGHSAERR